MPLQLAGRESMVHTIVETLTNGRDVAVEGMAGAGKTALAIAIARHREILGQFRDGILWAGLGPQPVFMSVLGGWASALGHDVAHLREVDERRAAVNRRVGQRHLLLILDDAWSIEDAESLRCGGPNAHHLLTTRDKGIARAFAGVSSTFSLPPIDHNAALSVLRALAPEACAADPAAVSALAGAVGGLPLALQLVGGYLGSPERSMFAAVTSAALRELGETPRRRDLVRDSLSRTIAFSLNRLPRAAANAFDSLGAFASQPELFSLSAAEHVAATDATTLALLARSNLLSVHGEMLSMHIALAEVARDRVSPEAVARHRDYYIDWVKESPTGWSRIDTALGQIRWAWERAPDDGRNIDMVMAMRSYHDKRGLSREGIVWSERALHIAEAAQRTEQVAALLNDMAMFHLTFGEAEAALPFLRRAHEIRSLRGDDAGHAQTLSDLAVAHSFLGNRAMAITYQTRALAMRERLGDSVAVAQSRNNLGHLHEQNGDHARALELYERAFAEITAGGDSTGLLTILHNIGNVHAALGRPAESLEYLLRSAGAEAGDTSRGLLANTFHDIGFTYTGMSQWPEALDYYQRAIAIEETMDPNRRFGKSLYEAGRACNRLGRQEEALAYYARAAAVQEDVGDSEGRGDTFNNVGYVYLGLERWTEAADYFSRALAILENTEHLRGHAAALNNLGITYGSQCLWTRALGYHERAVTVAETLGDSTLIRRFQHALEYVRLMQ